MPDAMRSRLRGVFVVVVAGGPRIGDLRAGTMAAITGAMVSWVAGGVACAVAVVVLGFLAPAFLRYDATTPARRSPPPATPGPTRSRAGRPRRRATVQGRSRAAA